MGAWNIAAATIGFSIFGKWANGKSLSIKDAGYAFVYVCVIAGIQAMDAQFASAMAGLIFLGALFTWAPGILGGIGVTNSGK